jgi:FAD:protein FMN transferase
MVELTINLIGVIKMNQPLFQHRAFFKHHAFFKRHLRFALRNLTILILAITVTACDQSTSEMQKLEGNTQGTTYHITYFPSADHKVNAKKIEDEISAELERIDLSLSNYRDDSVIEKFNANETDQSQSVDAELVKLVEQARSVYQASNGCYDLTIKPLFDLWGFKKDVFSPPSDENLSLAMSTIGMNYLETVDATHLRKLIPKMRIDVSSIGQGYTVSRIASILEDHQINNYLVEIGGELKTKGKKTNDEPWKIALEKPLPNERKLHKIVSFDSGEPYALMASGTYRHYFDSKGKRYSHIIDARTGKPIEHNTVSVAVLNPDPTIADAWSTALLCLGSQEGLKVANTNNITALFIDDQNGLLVERNSKGLNELKGISLSEP